MKRVWILLLLGIVIVAGVRSTVFVDETQYVIVTQFGKPVAVLDEPGLHFKPPYQSALRIDKRLQIYDPRPSEFLTVEKKNLDLDLFVCWKVADPMAFLNTVGDVSGAEARLHDIVFAAMAAEIGRTPLDELVTDQPDTHRLGDHVEAVAETCRKQASERYGIELVDVEIKRIGLPAQVRESVFQRMRAERARLARQYRAEGEQQSTQIRAEADKNAQILIAQAEAEAAKLRGEGEAEAARLYAEAYAKDPQFFEFLRTLEAYRKILDEKTTVFLRGDSPLFRYLNGELEPSDDEPVSAEPVANETAH
ncbi:MAG: protease modulator HflC [Planctomycetota bacterium]|nr:MAG: protease modulator HflC [Planctomycetota bacterium]